MTSSETAAHWLRVCYIKAEESPDPRTKVGCVILSPDGSVPVITCNTYPRGIAHDAEGRSTPPAKYLWLEHAERNAIYESARRGFATSGCTMFVQLVPCVECARAIIQAGIAEVVIDRERSEAYEGRQYQDHRPMALALLAEAGVRVLFASL